MDNASGYFETFQRESVVMRMFPPNVTSWKQPCDLGVLAAVKTRYKFLRLEYTLSLYQLDNGNQQLLKEKEGSKFRRWSGVVRYDRRVTRLDAANYDKEEWDKGTDETIENSVIRQT